MAPHSFRPSCYASGPLPLLLPSISPLSRPPLLPFPLHFPTVISPLFCPLLSCPWRGNDCLSLTFSLSLRVIFSLLLTFHIPFLFFSRLSNGLALSFNLSLIAPSFLAHWLSVHCRIELKIFLITFNALLGPKLLRVWPLDSLWATVRPQLHQPHSAATL